MHSLVRAGAYVVLRLPSGILKLVEATPNTSINLGKYGTFSANQIIGRPYHVTYELLDKEDGKAKTELRIVPASELHAEALGSDRPAPVEPRDEVQTDGSAEYDIVGEDGEVIMRNNRMTVDDPSRQALSMEDIEELKKAGTGSGKEIVAKIMASHMALEEKTIFSLAKYTLRKSRKYLKRFTLFPLDVGMLTEHILEKEAYRIMELREETLGLVCSWANIHCGTACRILHADDGISQIGGGRWLVVDDTGGLVTAALAEKLGILYPSEEEEDRDFAEEQGTAEQPLASVHDTARTNEVSRKNGIEDDVTTEVDSERLAPWNGSVLDQLATSVDTLRPRRGPHRHIPQMLAETNTLTVLHPNNQPNLSHLKYFGYDIGAPSNTHPLYHHLKSVSWLQLLHPTDDPSYLEPEVISDEVLATMKSSKRGTYFKKRRRWEKTKRVVDETRRGGFDGLVVASSMEPHTILNETVPLVKGGGRVVVYSPSVEPLVELCDYYSKERRAAYMAWAFGPQRKVKKMKREIDDQRNDYRVRLKDSEEESTDTEDSDIRDEDFPVNPTLLLAPSLQTVRARHWQVLPERTHPFMTSRGGAEGYLFTATRVFPVEGRVEARGHGRGKKRKTGPETSVQA